MFGLVNEQNGPPERSKERLDGWKEIASYLRRDISTLHRWEQSEELPVHRHLHNKRPSVYAYRSELDAWWNNRGGRLEGSITASRQALPFRIRTAIAALVIVAAGSSAAWWFNGDTNLPTPSLLTTSSKKAVKHFNTADEHMRARRYVESETSLRAAISEDPNFALAYTWLAWTLRNRGTSEPEWMYWAQHGVKLAQNASEREQLHAQASLYTLLGNWIDSVPVYERLLEIAPRDYWAINNLMHCYFEMGKENEGRQLAYLKADVAPGLYEAHYAAAWWASNTIVERKTNGAPVWGQLDWEQRDRHRLRATSHLERAIELYEPQPLPLGRQARVLLFLAKRIDNQKLIERAEEVLNRQRAFEESLALGEASGTR